MRATEGDAESEEDDVDESELQSEDVTSDQCQMMRTRGDKRCAIQELVLNAIQEMFRAYSCRRIVSRAMVTPFDDKKTRKILRLAGFEAG